MKWFKHDSDAMTDSKIRKLILKHGAVGYAVYFHCLELIASSVSETNINFELEHDAEIIADDLKINGSGTESGAQIVENIMRTIIDLKLFEESDGHIFCLKLLKRLDTSMTSNKYFRTLIAEAKSARIPQTQIPALEATQAEEPKQEEIPYEVQTPGEEQFSYAQKEYAKKIFDLWNGAGLPCPKSGYITFMLSDFRMAVAELQKEKLHSSSVIAAVENYIKIMELKKAGKTWWNVKYSFDNFAKFKNIKRFLPDYFDITEYQDMKKKNGSAVAQSGADSSSEGIDF